MAPRSERKKNIKRRECRVSNLARIYGALCKTAFLNSAIQPKILFLLRLCFYIFPSSFLLLYLPFGAKLTFLISLGQSERSDNIHLCIGAALTFINLEKWVEKKFYHSNFYIFNTSIKTYTFNSSIFQQLYTFHDFQKIQDFPSTFSPCLSSSPISK